MSILKKLYSRSSRKAHHLFGDAMHFVGTDNNIYSQARGSRIMVYHGICQDAPTRFNTLFITKATFEEHLKVYKKHFNIITLADFYDRRFSNDKFNICLTFDDGFANNYHYVLPLLEQYQLPATFFVTAINAAGYDILWNDFLSIAGKLGPAEFTFKNEIYYKNHYNKYVSFKGVALAERLRHGSFDEKAELLHVLDKLTSFHRDKQHPDYWLQMTGEQIKALSASQYATIGSHGYYHNDLSLIDTASAEKEVVQSKNYLENLTGKEINSIAFPYGAYNADVLNIAQKTGYKQLLATEFNIPQDQSEPALRERLTINPFISTTNQMYATIRGEYY
ncbi:polysaccharide deacetylase family protein [Mucilaginibacter sp.]|jgi:peptidoglycan/xylan/chitin deacetylase (PgdA/CDA1 family)|uniref:polysaccharide deacetylase family protein n=1 Tax=Mucilaginibacter sp. TaxID=1882438 RepID=UPI00356230B4